MRQKIAIGNWPIPFFQESRTFFPLVFLKHFFENLNLVKGIKESFKNGLLIPVTSFMNNPQSKGKSY